MAVDNPIEYRSLAWVVQRQCVPFPVQISDEVLSIIAWNLMQHCNIEKNVDSPVWVNEPPKPPYVSSE